MPSANIAGINISYELIGDGDRAWSLTPGGRFPMDTPGLREFAETLSRHNSRVLIWDRPNAGASDVCFEGQTESNLHADTLAGLLEHLDMTPAVVAGGSAGSRVSLLTAARHPEAVQGMALWWISGRVMGQVFLANIYCQQSIHAAWRDGMEAVADLPEWAEVIKRNPGNRQRFLDQDRDTFIATMERWMSSYLPRPDELISGLPDEQTKKIQAPALVFRSGASDPFHPRETSEAVAALLPHARLVDPPWGDREWHERQAERPKTGGVCVRWHLLTPQLVAWADEVLGTP